MPGRWDDFYKETGMVVKIYSNTFTKFHSVGAVDPVGVLCFIAYYLDIECLQKHNKWVNKQSKLT